jgi:alginate O-acetyltransferase complex protein AlgI
MSFSSITFIFVFLPFIIVLFYIVPTSTWRNTVLVVSSLVFFGWSDFRHIPVLVLFILLNYVFGILIDRNSESEKKLLRSALLWAGIGINLMMLFYYKYLGYFGDVLYSISQGQIQFSEQAFLLGVSYMTFSGISLILDVHTQSKPAEKNFLKVASFLIMFPKLIQGPITLFRDFDLQLAKSRFFSEDMRWGISRFILGLAKKVLLADTLVVAANKVFSSDPESLGMDAAWIGLIAYSLVIYFDFSGYTDMALGIGRMFGIKLPENFNYPYVSRNLTDFWRRWHMSLTNWFRTYVFFPLEFARRREKFMRQQCNILIVFFLTGLWHGASWNFIIWGCYSGLILAIEASGFRRMLMKIPVLFQHLYSLVIILFGWILFRITNIQQWKPFMGALIGVNQISEIVTTRELNLLLFLPVILIGIIFSTPLLSKIFPRKIRKKEISKILFDFISIGIFLLSISYILSNGLQSFIYAQF